MMARLKITRVGIGVGIAVAAVAVWLNALPMRHPGMALKDMTSPFDEPWFSSPRVEYGWPATAFRVFDRPLHFDDPGKIDRNDPGKIDIFGIAVDLCVWGCALGAAVLGPGLFGQGTGSGRTRRA